MSRGNFILSVVMPVYNVEKYIEQSIDSVVSQSIGFVDNIQLIIVNDGSEDSTGDICKSYADKYPDNVVYVDQKNSGVSAARNNGISRASGKYIAFLDGDDVWSEDSFEEAVRFLDSNKEVDFVAMKIKFFDKIIDSHPYNFKFDKTRVIDVNKEPDSPILHLVTCVFRIEAFHGKSFDTQLKISEDAKLLSEILLGSKKYGVLSRGQYNYRKRQDESSAIGGQRRNRDFFLVTPKRAYEYMLDLWTDESGTIHPFMQYQIVGDLVWRITMDSQQALDKNEESEYKRNIYNIIKRLDTGVIVSKRDLNLRLKVFLLKSKYGAKFDKHLEYKNGKYYIDDIFLCDNTSGNTVFIDFIKHTGGNNYKIEGYLPQPLISAHSTYTLRTSLGSYSLKHVDRPKRVISFLGDIVYDGGAFEAEVEISSKGDSIIAGVLDSRGKWRDIGVVPNTFSGLTPLPTSYHVYGDNIFTIYKRKFIKTTPRSSLEVTKNEIRQLVRILFSWRLGYFREQLKKIKSRNLYLLSVKGKLFEVLKPFLIVAEAVLMIPRALLLRFLYHSIKPFIKSPIWLISDRGMAAGDNGEALFRYIYSGKSKPYANVYFVISKKSQDYTRLKKVGKVVNQDSLYYKLLFLLSSKVISSQADIEVTNPFFRQHYHYADLFYFDFIFLQHGIIRNDLSEWLNRFNKNIKLFITSAQKEYRSILEYPYHYTNKEVVLTGLPRYDYLNNSPKGKLIIAPTYRKAVARKKTNANGMRPYDELFKESEYYKSYNKLINDKRIIQALKDNNMTGEFYLHPVFAPQHVDYRSNDYIKVMEFPYDYKKAFNEGSVLVTDYSSVVFDFAYLKKPVIYYKFDEDSFFSQQIYKEADFFDDDRDGFGPIARSHEEVVDMIINTINNSSAMQSKYIKRVDNFFYKTDTKNSKRVYDSIVRLDRGSSK